MRSLILFWIFTSFLLVSCSGEEYYNSSNDPDGDIDTETEAGGPFDVASCYSTSGKTCTSVDAIPELTIDKNQKKFALSMFHYNIQYVAGGLEAEINGEKVPFCGDLCVGLSDEKVNDWIIKESFEPVLDFYLEHKNWRGTFEMQALMVEEIAARHPEVLKKLQEASQAGQIELVSFHYSAQLFLAFPKEDLKKSIEMTKAIFDKYCLPLSGVVFNQEGQAGEGKHAFMKEMGYTISVFPKNLYRYVRFEEKKAPYYKDHGVDVIIGPGEVDPDSGISVNWTFFDDGELLTTPLDPYFAFTSEADMKLVEEYRVKLENLEKDGYKITTITDYVNHMKAEEIAQPDLPPVIDGTWQPTSTSSVLRWMGGRSVAPYASQERDSDIRTENYRVRTTLAAYEKMLDEAALKGNDVCTERAKLDEAWRHLFLAMVTDATGITPWMGEFLYAVNNNAEAMSLGGEAFESLKTMLGLEYAEVDLETGEVKSITEIPTLEKGEKVDSAPVSYELKAPTRTPKEQWYKLSDNLYELEISFEGAADPKGKKMEEAFVSVAFDRKADEISYTPALLDDTVVSYKLSEFNFQKEEIYLPLANGLLYLGDGWWVVKDCRSVHLAPKIDVTGTSPKITFLDETANPEKGSTWRFFLFKGDKEEALKLADKTNAKPKVYH